MLCLSGVEAGAQIPPSAFQGKAIPPRKPITITGKVLLPNGKPAVGAAVWAGWSRNSFQSGFTEGRTDASGRFRLSPPAGALRFLCAGAAVPQLSATWKRLRAVPDLDAVTLKVPPPTSVSARLIRTNGRPAVGVSVRVKWVVPRMEGGADDWQYSGAVFPPSPFEQSVGRSDAHGRIRLPGVPVGAEVTLLVGGDLVPATGKAPSWLTDLPGENPNGCLVLTEPGEFELRVVTPEGQPLPGLRLPVRRVPSEATTDLAKALSQRAFHSPDSASEDGPDLEMGRDGEARSGPLLPGVYEIPLRGGVTRVVVHEGEVTGPVRIVARVGALRGQVQDEAGKPVAGATVEVDEIQSTVTNSLGEFVLPEFPWAAQKVSITVRHGAAGTEWTSRGEALWGRPLTLRIERDHYRTVRGVLTNENGNPLETTNARLVYRDGAGAEHPVKMESGTDGRFSVVGPPKAAPFAIVHNAPDGLLTSGIRPPTADANPLDLGRVALVQQRAEMRTAEPTRLLAIPTTPEVAKAQAAATKYLHAVLNGDLRSAHALVSRESPTYAPQLEEWARRHPLTLPPTVTRLPATAVRPMLALQRSTLQAILFTYPQGEMRKLLDQAFSRPDWVVLGFGGGKDVNGLAVMHRDGEGWKLVGGALTDFVVLSTASNARALFGVPAASVPAQALESARSYFRAWSGAKPEAVLALTHPKSTEWASAIPTFRKRQAERPDRGMPPIRKVPDFQPETRLSRWDHSLLFAYPALEFSGRLGALPGASVTDPFGAQIRAGGTAVLRYRARGSEWLALLVRHNGKWLMLEPAWPA